MKEKKNILYYFRELVFGEIQWVDILDNSLPSRGFEKYLLSINLRQVTLWTKSLLELFKAFYRKVYANQGGNTA